MARDPHVGRRYGEWTVLARTDRRQGQHRIYRLRCSCGHEWERPVYHAVRGDSARCPECRNEQIRQRGKERLSVRLPDGRTLAQVADACGLKLNTVHQRWRRGWPAHLLGIAPSEAMAARPQNFTDRGRDQRSNPE